MRAADKRALFVGVERLRGGGRHSHARPVPGRRRRLAARTRHCSTSSWPRSSSARPRPWPPRAGSGSRSRPDFAYGHHFGLRQLRGDVVALTAEEEATRDALREEYDRLEEGVRGRRGRAGGDRPAHDRDRDHARHAGGSARRIRPGVEVARAGAFVSIDGAGALKVERGYIRPEDELPVSRRSPRPTSDADGAITTNWSTRRRMPLTGGSTVQGSSEPAPEPEEEDGIKPLPDRLLTELTAHRTLALRNAHSASSPRWRSWQRCTHSACGCSTATA